MTINVIAATRQIVVVDEIPPIEVVVQGGGGGGLSWPLVHPLNPNARITADADGGFTITSDVRLTIKGPSDTIEL